MSKNSGLRNLCKTEGKDMKTLNAESEWRGQISEAKFKKVN